jgi:predicted phage tail protein
VIDQEVYDVRVKAVNSIGASSTYVSATRTIVGAIAPPSDVEDFSCKHQFQFPQELVVF